MRAVACPKHGPPEVLSLVRVKKPEPRADEMRIRIRATAAVYGGSPAIQYADRGNIRPGHRILIYGPTGTSGTNAVQYAKSLGAHVTGVCSTKYIEFVRSLGADEVLDYTRVLRPRAAALP